MTKTITIALFVVFLWVPSAAAYEATTRSATREIVSSSKERRSNLPKSGPTVFVSKTDTRFHSIDCPRLHNPEDHFNLDDAMRAGYGPCSRCSREILKRTSYKPLGRSGRRKARRATSGLISGGPPYIVIVSPQHRTAGSLLPLIW